MNEQACTVVCFIFAALCSALFSASARTGNQGAMILGMAFSIVVTLLSSYVVICRYLQGGIINVQLWRKVQRVVESDTHDCELL